MDISSAVVTAAGPEQRNLPLQTLIDRDGDEKSVLRIVVEEVLRAGVEEVCVVVQPGDEAAYSKVVGEHAGRLRFVNQTESRGYGHAVYCARDFVGDRPFLHLVSDHLYISQDEKSCAQRLVATAEAEECAVSSVQATRENLLPLYGTVGGTLLQGNRDLYRIETVVEKPTPTEAEQTLVVPGLRAGHYLCFFGMHALTPTVMGILADLIGEAEPGRPVTLSDALASLARKEQYLALRESSRRYDVGVRYGTLTAQLALALSGKDRDEVLAELVMLLAQRGKGPDVRGS